MVTVQTPPSRRSPDLLDRISVTSRAAGRIRFRLDFKGDAFLRDAIRRELQRREGVRLISYSSRTRTALVVFDASRADPVDVAEAMCRGVTEFARVHGECDLSDHRHELVGHAPAADTHDHDHEHESGEAHTHLASDEVVRKDTVKLLGTGLVLAWLVLRRVRGLGRVAPGSPLTDLGAMMTIASGYPILRSGARSAARGKPTDDTLIGIAVIATLLLGESLTGLSVVWLIQLGRLLESVTLRRSRLAIADLMDLAPPETWRITWGTEQGSRPTLTQVRVEHVEKGDLVRVFHFEKVPLDGRVRSGEALVQESFITGEALPRSKRAGDTVYAGSIVESGEIDVEVTSLVHETLVARMVASVQDLHERRAPIERIGNRFASRFVPVSLALAGATFLLTRDWYKAVTMLVIACPCAAGLATPTAVSASIGGAAKRGILIKGGVHLEKAARVDVLVVDKTGTVTAGAPTITSVRLAGGSTWTEEACLRLAAAVERHATHPLALAFTRDARRRRIEIAEVADYVPHPGLGVEGTVGGSRVLVGNRSFLERRGVELPEAAPMTEHELAAGTLSHVHLAIDGRLAAIFTIADTIRPEARDALRDLRELGIRRIILASGDRIEPARFVASQLGIDEVHAELLPEEKLELVDRLRAEGHRIAMVGDGINDAQALAHADVSLAMGEGRCDLAIETADITLARNDLMLVPEALRIARSALRAIHENFAASIGVNLAGLAFGAAGKLSPFSAAIVHNLSTIAVVLNSFALQRRTAAPRGAAGGAR